MTGENNMSDKTRVAVGLTPRGEMDDLGNALGVSKMTPIVSAVYENDPILKAEKEMLRSHTLEIEDDPFIQLNINTLGEKNQILEPTYHPINLTVLTHVNNTLLQAISAMEVNIDGTGFEIERRDGEELEDKDAKAVSRLEEFFNESFPGESFLTLRRKVRRDLESTGNGYIEVIRNQKGEVVFLKHMESKMVRLLRLDEPTPVIRTLTRDGKEVTVKILERQRRFVQVVGRSMVRYFKAYGTKRDLDASNGKWRGSPDSGSMGSITGTPNTPEVRQDLLTNEIAPENIATEVIHLTALPDVLTPYGVPRWINNLPSVLGSRKAEEFNLEFFDHGGLPPAMILIQGGQLSTESRTTLTNYLAGKAKIKQRGIITEIFAASGDLGSAGNVKVSVERFGTERQNDSMFQKYDDQCAEHVRISFRLPPMFLGLSEAYNFATAYTAYMIAEAQVFLPERDEFDEMINLTIMKELGKDTYVYRSKGLNVVDVEQKLKALELSSAFMNPTSFIESINEITRTNFVPKEGIDEEVFENAVNEKVKEFVGASERRETEKEKIINTTGDGQGRVLKLEDDVLRELADDWAAHLMGDYEFDDVSKDAMSKLVQALAPPLRKLFNGYVGMKMSAGGLADESVAKLIGCVGHRHDESEVDEE